MVGDGVYEQRQRRNSWEGRGLQEVAEVSLASLQLTLERRLRLCSGAGWLGNMGWEEGAGRAATAIVAARGAQRAITQPGAKLLVRRHVSQCSLGGDRALAWENLGVFAFLFSLKMGLWRASIY